MTSAARRRPPRREGGAPPRHGARCGSREAPAAPPSASERYGIGAIPIPPATSSGRATSRSKPFPSGPRTWIASPGRSAQSARVPGPDRLDEERELARRRLAEAHRPREEQPGRLEHEELAGKPGLEPAPLEPEQRVRPDLLRPSDGEKLPARRAPPSAELARVAGSALTPRSRSAPGATASTRRARSRSRAPPPPRRRSSSRTERARRARPRG